MSTSIPSKSIPSDSLRVIDWPETQQDHLLDPDTLAAIDQVVQEKGCSLERAIIHLLSDDKI